MNRLTRWWLSRRGHIPTDKMIEEAINWTGPFLRERATGQQFMYVRVLRNLAMAVSKHPDLVVGHEEAETMEGTNT